jgi:DNA-binding NtrC family response regulator
MIASMTAAYEDALRVLRLADRQDPITELVARKIIQVARSGGRDPTQIREQALKELGINPERFS